MARTWWAAGLTACAGVALAADLVLVGPDRAPLPVVSDAASEAHAKALARYLSQIAGVPFAAQVAERAPEGGAILVGDFGGSDVADLPGDSFEIVCRGGTLRITGATPSGTAFGVYAFLEEMLGCRWWSFDEEDVPRLETIRVPETNRVTKAVFSQTLLMNREAQNRANAFEYKARVKNALAWSGGHTMYPLLTPYATNHPDIYPYSKKTGKRAANNLHFCYSAPDIAQALADALENEMQKRRGNVHAFIYMAGMGDWYGGGCECERCQAINLEEGWTDTNKVRRAIMGGTNLRMMNRTAEILEGRHPGVKVGTMAYMSMEAPPTVTKPRHNVYVQIPHLRHCIIHGVRECAKNKGYANNLRKWAQLAPNRVYVWDYGVNFGDNFMYPFPVLFSIGDNIKHYAEIGLAGLLVQGNYVSTGSDLVVLKNYVWRRLMWNPALDTESLVREFCEGYYGSAAKPLFDYVMELERAVSLASLPETHLDEFVKRDGMRKHYLTSDREKRLRVHLEAARAAAAGTDPFARRVEEAAASLEAFALWHPGPFAEQAGKLVRADLGNAYTYDRAFVASANSRQASAREWGPFRGYQLNFVALQGGPLAVLKRGDVEVTAAPGLALRIRQIRFKGVPLLRVAGDVKEKGWPNLGGLYELVRSGWVTGVFEGEPTATSVVMRADAVSRGNVRQTGRKTISLEEDGTIRIAVAAKRVSREPDYENTRATLGIEYAAGKKGGWRVDAKTADGAWQTLLAAPAVTGSAPKGAKPDTTVLEAKAPAGVQALRVRLPAAGCVVEELFSQPAMLGGAVSFDPATGILKTAMSTETQQVDYKEERTWLQRALRVRPE